MGPGPFGSGPRAHLGPGPLGPGPIWVQAHLGTLWGPICPIMGTDVRKNKIDTSKHENRAMDPSNNANYIEFYGESDGTSPRP